jgi:hypothetical protein
MNRDRARQLAMVQGVYFTATGIWPLIDMRSFERVTGPKADKWLVKTVGVLVAVIGGTLLASARRGAVPRDVRALAVGAALGLGVIDVIYAGKGRISPVYLGDAAAEAALVAAWMRASSV